MVDEVAPDLVFHDVFRAPRGFRVLGYACPRVLYSGENVPVNRVVSDFSLTSDHATDPRHLRLPVYREYGCFAALAGGARPDPAAALAAKTGFCNYVYSNAWAPETRVREAFFERLSRQRRVDAGGACHNNLGYRVADKLAFIARYKFTIAFENSSQAGYTTEKLVEPLAAGSVPIYWGDPEVGRTFNRRAFVNCHDFPSWEAVVAEVLRLDADDDAYRAKLAEPPFTGGRLPEDQGDAALIAFLERVGSFALATRGRPPRRAPRALQALLAERDYVVKKSAPRSGAGYLARAARHAIKRALARTRP